MKNSEKMNRRKFLELSAIGAATASAGALMLNVSRIYTSTKAFENSSVMIPQDAKKVFSKCGTCSNTFFTLLNREFGCPRETEEFATDPLAGGLMSSQNQCGMLWGSTLAVGAESFRRNNNSDMAVSVAMSATQNIVHSFSNRAKSVNCRNIVDFDFKNNSDTAKFLLKSLPGGFQNLICSNLAEKWYPEAILAAKEGLSEEQIGLSLQPKSCASEVAKRMGASDEEMVMVAGLAGGIGLSGNGCGALGAAIWMNTLSWCRNNPGKSGYLNPGSNEIFERFIKETGSEILCSKLSGQSFKTIDDHTEFLNNGGCEKLIDALVQS